MFEKSVWGEKELRWHFPDVSWFLDLALVLRCEWSEQRLSKWSADKNHGIRIRMIHFCYGHGVAWLFCHVWHSRVVFRCYRTPWMYLEIVECVLDNSMWLNVLDSCKSALIFWSENFICVFFRRQSWNSSQLYHKKKTSKMTHHVLSTGIPFSTFPLK